MKSRCLLIAAAFAATAFIAAALAQSAAPVSPSAAAIPADPWPRVVDLSNAQVLVYQPQVNKWDGNQIDFRCALAIKPTGAKDETFGVIFATARTQVDKVARTVVFENLKITKSRLSDAAGSRGALYAAGTAEGIRASVRTIALDRLEASLALAGIKPPTVEVQNNPPQVIVSYSPAILVPDRRRAGDEAGARPLARQRVINTRALILQGGFGNDFYIHVYDGWLTATAICGPWTQAYPGPLHGERR